MGLDVYFRRDIANVLRATACASEGAAGLAQEWMADSAGTGHEPGGPGPGAQGTCDSDRLLQAYRQGVRHALVSVGLAFGLEPVGAGAQPRPGVAAPLAGLLWAEVPREP